MNSIKRSAKRSRASDPALIALGMNPEFTRQIHPELVETQAARRARWREECRTCNDICWECHTTEELERYRIESTRRAFVICHRCGRPPGVVYGIIDGFIYCYPRCLYHVEAHGPPQARSRLDAKIQAYWFMGYWWRHRLHNLFTMGRSS